MKDDLSSLDKAIGAVLGQRTIERNQMLVSMAKSKLSKSRDDKSEKVTKPEELVRLYDLLLQVMTFFSLVNLILTFIAQWLVLIFRLKCMSIPLSDLFGPR